MFERQPSVNDYRRLGEEIDAAYAALPVDGVTFVVDELTDQSVIEAPEGKGFRLTGNFDVDTEQSAIEYWGGPRPSVDAILEEMQDYEPFQRLVTKADGDVHKAAIFLLCQDDVWGDIDEDAIIDFELPANLLDEFVGRHVAIKGKLSRDNTPQVDMVVYGEPDMWMDTGFLVVEIPLFEGSREYEQHLAQVETGPEWQRPFARGTLGKCTLSLCDIPPIEQQIHLVSQATPGVDMRKLQLPEEETSHEYVRNYAKWYELDLSAEELEEYRLDFIRARRGGGRAFRDDILRHFQIATPQTYAYWTGETIPQIVRPVSVRTTYSGIVLDTDIPAAEKRFRTVRQKVHDDIHFSAYNKDGTLRY